MIPRFPCRTVLIPLTITVLLGSTRVSYGQSNEPLFFREGRTQFEQQIRDLQETDSTPILTISGENQAWQPLVSEEGRFTVWLPIVPYTEQAETITILGTDYPFQTITSTTSSHQYLVAYAPVADDLSPQDVLTDLGNTLAATTDQVTLSQRRTLDDSPFPAQELMFKGDDTTLAMRLAVVNGNIYVIGVKQMVPGDLNLDSLAFLGSFQPMP